MAPKNPHPARRVARHPLPQCGRGKGPAAIAVGRVRELGFTLIELLVVLAILALLAGVVGPRVIDYFSRSKAEIARLQIDQLGASLDLFRLDVGRYPTTQEGLAALVARPGNAAQWHGPYLKGTSVPADPWGRAYQYRSPGGEGRGYDLFSLGDAGNSSESKPILGR